MVTFYEERASQVTERRRGEVILEPRRVRPHPCIRKIMWYWVCGKSRHRTWKRAIRVLYCYRYKMLQKENSRCKDKLMQSKQENRQLNQRLNQLDISVYVCFTIMYIDCAAISRPPSHLSDWYFKGHLPTSSPIVWQDVWMYIRTRFMFLRIHRCL